MSLKLKRQYRIRGRKEKIKWTTIVLVTFARLPKTTKKVALIAMG
jgi:hypothetical protein